MRLSNKKIPSKDDRHIAGKVRQIAMNKKINGSNTTWKRKVGAQS